MWRIRRTKPLIALTVATMVGCTSVTSTYLHRNENDSRWVRTKGKGFPVTLDVPTHLRIDIYENIYLNKREGEFVRDLTNKALLRSRMVSYDVITEKKMMLVDFKRPAAGLFENKVSFEKQYLKAVDTKSKDETIAKVGGAINEILKTVIPIPKKAAPGKQAAERIGSVASSNDISVKGSWVAGEVFKLDDPEFEVRLSDFLGRYTRGYLTEVVSAPPGWGPGHVHSTGTTTLPGATPPGQLDDDAPDPSGPAPAAAASPEPEGRSTLPTPNSPNPFTPNVMP
jgi:hypothetical protein